MNTDLHKAVLDAFVGLCKEVFLVSSIADPGLGFPSKDEVRVFVPDLHLISAKRHLEGKFKFATNNEPLLVQVLTTLSTLRGLIDAGQSLTVITLGDTFDLWRETNGLDPTPDVPRRIAADHYRLMHALYGAALDATIFLGNHDFELYQWNSYQRCVRKRFFPDGAPQVLVLHGDIFDWVEKIPNAIKRFFVYFFSPDAEPTTYVLGQMSSAVRKTAPSSENPDYIHCETPAAMGALQPLKDQGLPGDTSHWNVIDANASGADARLFDKAFESAVQFNEKTGLDIRSVVIGHTHHARIVTRTAGGRPFTLIDCGAWIENCSVAGTEAGKMPNSQVGVLSGNEARIYQLVANEPAAG
jgi:UDP-2,3-diacylglucosamine pyrophosphatase LpxH